MTSCNDEITIPGCWECPQCGFILTKTEVRPYDESSNERCPNDGQMLKPETWKARCKRLAASCDQLLTKIQWLNDFRKFGSN
jgi:hypothetical protein